MGVIKNNLIRPYLGWENTEFGLGFLLLAEGLASVFLTIVLTCGGQTLNTFLLT